MVIRVTNKGITKQKVLKMKIQINRTQLMITELLQETVQALYNRNPDAYLLHADIEFEEREYDSQNLSLLVSGTFSVSVTPVIKVELSIYTSFNKFKMRNNGWTRCEGLFEVKHQDSGKSVMMANPRGKIAVWDWTNGETFQAMIGNPPPVPQ